MAIQYTKKRITLNFRDGKPTVYKAAQAQASQITFKKLCQEVAVAAGVPAAQTKAVVEGLIDRISTFVEEGHGVSLGEFGSFKPIVKVKTQQTEDAVDASTVKRTVLHFYPGKRFKDMLADITFQEDPAEYTTVLEPQPTNNGTTGGQQTGGGTGSGSGNGNNELGG